MMMRAAIAPIFVSFLAAGPVHADALKCVPHHHVNHARHVTHVTQARKVAESGIGVMIDEARMISFDRPAKTIYLGNPEIADINIIDAQHAFVLGKTFGNTNLIALDVDGNEISNRQLTVVNQTAAITLNRGTDQYSLSCTRAHCETAPRPGDLQSYVGNTEGTVMLHQNSASKSAGSSGGQTAQNDSAAAN